MLATQFYDMGYPAAIAIAFIAIAVAITFKAFFDNME